MARWFKLAAAQTGSADLGVDINPRPDRQESDTAMYFPIDSCIYNTAVDIFNELQALKVKIPLIFRTFIPRFVILLEYCFSK